MNDPKFNSILDINNKEDNLNSIDNHSDIVENLLSYREMDINRRDKYKDKLYTQISESLFENNKNVKFFNSIFIKARIGFIGIFSIVIIITGVVLLPNLNNINNFRNKDKVQQQDETDLTLSENELDNSLDKLGNQIQNISIDGENSSLTEADISF